MPAQTTQPFYLAVFVRIEIDKHADPGERITYHLHGDIASPVYLCGTPTETLEEAEAQARAAVNDLSRIHDCILPRVFQSLPDEDLIDVGDRAEEWYEKKLAEMNETDEITTDPSQRRYHNPDDPRPMQKLTADQVRELRALKGIIGSRETAKRFNIRRETVQRIWKGEARRDVI